MKLIRRIFSRFSREDREFYSLVRSLLNIRPDNIEVYKLALIHRSASVVLPDGTLANNERLEFLGDAVLETIISDFLFLEYTGESEGFLTQMRARIVSRTSLDEIAHRIGLDGHVIANFNGAYSHKHLYGNALEALIGAIYLDKGFDFTKKYVIHDILVKHVDLGDLLFTDSDFKSRLIEWCQKSKREIRFRTMHDEESTVQHPVFISCIIIDGIDLGQGKGASKKEAEQKASYIVTQIMSDEVGDFFLDSIDSRMEQNDEANG